MTEKEAVQLNPLTLAFLGDGVFTLFVRERLVSASDALAGALHVKAAKYVRASAQAKMIETLMPTLTKDESDVARRARNSHKGTRAKNASVSDYNNATALEALLGYLKITEQTERLNAVMDECMAIIDAQGEEK